MEIKSCETQAHLKIYKKKLISNKYWIVKKSTKEKQNSQLDFIFHQTNLDIYFRIKRTHQITLSELLF